MGTALEMDATPGVTESPRDESDRAEPLIATLELVRAAKKALVNSSLRAEKKNKAQDLDALPEFQKVMWLTFLNDEATVLLLLGQVREASRVFKKSSEKKEWACDARFGIAKEVERGADGYSLVNLLEAKPGYPIELPLAHQPTRVCTRQTNA